jgi:hypothetical protein
MSKRRLTPVHPGVVLAEGFLKGMEISQFLRSIRTGRFDDAP